MSLIGNLEKETIYIVLKTRPIPGEYHWALILTDPDNNPVLHHASSLSGHWAYERGSPAPSMPFLIALVKIDRVKSVSQAEQVIAGIPADGQPSRRTGDDFNCRTWLKDVFVALDERGVITLPKDIDTVENVCIQCGIKYAPQAEIGLGATVVNDAFDG